MAAGSSSSGPENPLRALLDALAEQSEQLSRELDRIYEESFVGSAGHPAFTVRTEADGTTVIRFGDGQIGRRPPHGRGSVVIEYRVGGRAAATVPPAGIHRGIVVEVTDPEGRGRLLVRVASVTGDATAWALPVVPPTSDDREGPSIGSAVWVLFEDADPTRPVWLGAIAER